MTSWSPVLKMGLQIPSRSRSYPTHKNIIMNNLLSTLLKDSAYKLTQFSSAQIQALENSITVKDSRGKATPYVTCLARAKEIKLTPEEAVRQLYLMVLMQDLSYPVDRIAIEYGVTFGRETKRADICIFDKDRPLFPTSWWN